MYIYIYMHICIHISERTAFFDVVYFNMCIYVHIYICICVYLNMYIFVRTTVASVCIGERDATG